jgi:hypothetical protein
MMPSKKKTTPTTNTGDVINATIGDNASQVAVGKNIHQQQASGAAQISEGDLKQIQALFENFKKQIEQQAPPDKKAAAVERVDELQQEIVSGKPELTTIDYVKRWFGKNLPGLLGGVTSLVVNPLVGKVVEAASGMAAAEIKRRFGGTP